VLETGQIGATPPNEGGIVTEMTRIRRADHPAPLRARGNLGVFMVNTDRGKRASTLDHRLRGSVAALVLLGLLPIVPAMAQDVPQVAQTSPQTETIEVTGSRIKNTDAQSANPITVVTSEEINKTEATTVEQFLRKLPDVDFTGGLNQNDNNGGYGASNLGLRNLGPQRTLILVNGQRFIVHRFECLGQRGRSQQHPGLDDRPHRRSCATAHRRPTAPTRSAA
jgi:hypothetical protein